MTLLALAAVLLFVAALVLLYRPRRYPYVLVPV